MLKPDEKARRLSDFLLERSAPGGVAGAVPQDAGPGFLMRGLDLVNRPYSAIMGGVHGAVSPDATVVDAFMEGLTGARQFGAYDVLTDLGADPESRWTRIGGLALDVVNPLDPLTYVGAGFTKAGRAARALEQGSKTLGKLETRAAAAALGQWSPVTYLGKAVVPKALSVPTAKAVDALGLKISESPVVQTLGRYFGGVRKWEKDFPKVSRVVRGLFRDLGEDVRGYDAEFARIEKGLLAQGATAKEVETTMRGLTSLLEAPEAKIYRLERESELIDFALSGKRVDWTPDDVLKTAEEMKAYQEAGTLTQQQVNRRVAELRAQRAVDSGQRTVDSELPVPDVARPAAAPLDEAGLRAVQLEDDVLENYLARSGGQVETRVRLKDLRKGLGRYSREEQDRILLQMQRDKKLVLYRLDDPQDIFQADREAELLLGKDPRHLVYLKPEALDAQRARLAAEAPRPQAALEGGAGRDAIADELHVLESVQVSRLAEDYPPEMTQALLSRKARIGKEIERVKAVRAGAGDDLLELEKTVRPLVLDTEKVYEDILRQYDAQFEFPLDDYLKHMFPVHWSKLPANLKKAQAAAEAKVQKLATDLAAKGWDEDAIAGEVQRVLSQERKAAGIPIDRTDYLSGEIDAFKRRQYNMSIDEVKQAFKDGKLPWQFEDHTMVIASAMRRDAARWKFGHDIHAWVDKQPGYTMTGDAYAALSKAEQKDWVPMQFHLPWIDPAKNPFRGKYMRREVNELVQAQLRGTGMLTNDEGLNAFMQSLHGIRRWWSAWTLAPFPNTRVRDFASDVALSYQGGLNPVVDLAKAVTGESAYAASMAFNLGKRGLPKDNGAWKLGQGNLDNLTSTLSQHFGQPVTVEDLRKYMEIEGITGQNVLRDLDLRSVLSNDPVVKAAMRERSKASKAKDWAPFVDPNRSRWVKLGFSAAENLADYTRSALFFDSLRKIAPEARSFEDALDMAAANVRKTLFDYSDLTLFERQVMRLVMPFYTFTSKNLPYQVNKMMTDPGHLAWVARLYEGAWGQYDADQLQPSDLPAWLEDSMGLPLHRIETEDGVQSYSVWSPRGWLPVTELNEMADLVRGKAGPQIVARLNPMLKESFEQMLNVDAYTERKIDDGTVRDLFGVVFEDLGVPNSLARRGIHLLNNLRLVSYIDRADPGGAWTKIGQHMGWWETERPHRFTAEGTDRAVQALLGWNIKGVAPESQAERNLQTAHLDANRARGEARQALRQGNTFEGNYFMEAARKHQEKAEQWKRRLGELRKRRALDVEKREGGGS